MATPAHNLRHLTEEFLWIWLHLLQFTTSNQSCSQTAVIEDADNKPDRPIPSGRITLTQARILRWSLVPICFWVSSWFGTPILLASVAVVSITTWYNEVNGGGRSWYTRNLLNGIGFGSFEVGAALLASKDYRSIDQIAFRSILTTTWIYATTTQAQDFKDVIGDKKIDRSTIALEFPRSGRPTMAVGILMWSIFLGMVWDIGTLASCYLICLAVFVGWRYCLLNGRRNDQVSFYWYNVSGSACDKMWPGWSTCSQLWLTSVYALPGLHRYRLGFWDRYSARILTNATDSVNKAHSIACMLSGFPDMTLRLTY